MFIFSSEVLATSHFWSSQANLKLQVCLLLFRPQISKWKYKFYFENNNNNDVGKFRVTIWYQNSRFVWRIGTLYDSIVKRQWTTKTTSKYKQYILHFINVQVYFLSLYAVDPNGITSFNINKYRITTWRVSCYNFFLFHHTANFCHLGF